MKKEILSNAVAYRESIVVIIPASPVQKVNPAERSKHCKKKQVHRQKSISGRHKGTFVLAMAGKSQKLYVGTN